MYHLTQDQLAHILFPLGRMYKKDTRRISEEKDSLLITKQNRRISVS